MEDKKKYKQGPQYDKRPEIKNYRRGSGFKIFRNIVIIVFVVFVILLLLFITSIKFNSFTSTKEDLIDTKWEFSFKTSGYKYYYIKFEDMNIYSYSRYLQKPKKRDIIYNQDVCPECYWNVEGDSILLATSESKYLMSSL